ncbi:MAG TPA: TonB family protein [Thermoanaerobaculia bacterium]
MIEIHPLVHDAVVSWAPFALAASVLGAVALGGALLASRRGAGWMSARSRYMLLSIALIVPAAAAILVPTQIGGWASVLGSAGEGAPPIAGTVDTNMRFTPVAGGDAGIDVLCVLAALWGAGFLIILFTRSGEWTMWQRVVRRSEGVDDPRLIAAFRRASGAGGSPPELRVSRDCDEPMVVGLAFPVVLVPHGYGDAMEDAELEAVAVHELEHVRRRDNLDAALIDLFAALFWFDPFHWIARRRFLALREGACDERVLERGLSAPAYLSALAKTSHAAIESPAVACMSGFRIRERMDSIMTYANHSSTWIPESRVRAAALAMLAIVAIAIAGFAPAAAEDLLGGPQHRLSVVMTPAANDQILIQAEIRTPDGTLVAAPKVMANAGTPVEFTTSSQGRSYKVSVTPAADGSGFAKLEVLEGREIVDTVVKSIEAPKMRMKTPAEPITLHLAGADLRDVARTLAEITGLDVKVADSVEGKITIWVDDVPWDEALVKAIEPLGLRAVFTETAILIAPAGEMKMRTPLPPPPPGYERVGDDVKPPKVLTRVDPTYPEEARKERVQGIVIVEALIGADGVLKDVKALKELPYGLTEAAVDAVRQWTFAPALKDGKPVPVAFNLTINFKLDGGKKAAEKQ